MVDFDPKQLQKVHRFLKKYFNRDELHTLCFDLGLEYEDLPGNGKAANARELVDHCRRHGKLLELLERLRQEQPGLFEAAGLAALLGEPGAVSFPADLVEGAPHPIAWACAGVNAAQSDKKRFEALDRLLVNLVKYLAAIALSQYWQDNPDKEQLRAWLGELDESRLVTSLNMLDRVGEHYAGAPEKPDLYPVLFQPYQAPVGDESPLAAAYRAVERAQVEEVTPRAFLARLLSFREAEWESDAGGVEPAVREALLPDLAAGLKHLLENFEPLFGYPLYYVERVDRAGRDWMYTLVAFPSARGKPVVVKPFREREVEEPAHKAHHLYLCSPEGRPLLDLHPILYARRPSYELYFLARGDEKGELWYRHCASAKRYNPPAYYRLFSDSLAREAGEVAEGDDPVAQLEQARDELEKAEEAAPMDETPLPVLLAHLSDEARQALELALGEALRIGQFWLGVEFLLMGLSRQEGGALSEVPGRQPVAGPDCREGSRSTRISGLGAAGRRHSFAGGGSKTTPAASAVGRRS